MPPWLLRPAWRNPALQLRLAGCFRWGRITDQVIAFHAATLYFEMGRLDEAFSIFDWEFKTWKTLPFKKADRKYLDFYLDRKKAWK